MEVTSVSDPLPLAAGGTWTAEFDGYDLRMGAAYYFVRAAPSGSDEAGFWVRVDVRSGRPEPDYQREQLQAAADAGRSNTDYRGSTLWQIRNRG